MSPDEVAELREELASALAEAERGEWIDFTADQVIAEGERILADQRQDD
jgi:hypothetical protein